MATRTLHYDSSFTLAQLNTTCQTDEKDLRGQLQSLDAVQNTAGVNVTEAVYDTAKRTNLGGITIMKIQAVSGLQAFNGTAFIENKDENVACFR